MTLPAVGLIAPAINPTSVDLPAPFGPMTPSTSPWRTATLRLSTAGKPPKRLLRPSNCSRGKPAAGSARKGASDAVVGDEPSDTSRSFDKTIAARDSWGGALEKLLHQQQEALRQQDRD